MFAASMTFLGWWFVLAASPNSEASKLPVHEYLFGRTGVMACGLIDLVLSAVIWCRQLGATAGLTAWAASGLISWVLIKVLFAVAPRSAAPMVLIAFIVVIFGALYTWAI